MYLNFNDLKSFSGEIYADSITIASYATDASAYRQLPLAVAYPKNSNDIQSLIQYAHKNRVPLIPRAAGTSLAGQVVGEGIIVDVSRYLNRIIEVNEKERYVWVEPGVVLDELNLYLKKYNLFFAPETSTSNRCTIGGMVGNNACGAHSLIYGSTRDHLLEVKGFLSDGTFVHFKPLTISEFKEKLNLPNLEGNIYRNIYQALSDPANRAKIKNEYPDPSLKRRNTGYAIDSLIDNQIFEQNNKPFNFCSLIAGSEGTLLFITEIKLNLLPIESKVIGLVCAHFTSLEEALYANLVALQFKPDAIELIDDVIIRCTENNIEQQKNRFFIHGNPAAILLIEFSANNKIELEAIREKLEVTMQDNQLGYAFPIFYENDIPRIWALRKAALGLLTNIPGDAKPVSLVEDNAIPVTNLPHYIAEFKELLAKYGLSCVFHAHIATGELHTRPIINLKTKEGIQLFRKVATETAYLVKKYKGSISGEHGDGRLRSEFIPIIIGQHNYDLCKQIKYTWDPKNIFNPGKIVDPSPMDVSLRYQHDYKYHDFDTYFNFSDTHGMIRHIEQCNGSADCRKSALFDGVMCPSYKATGNERLTTRARANVMREFMTTTNNPFDRPEIIEILDECLSCKGCKSECPSNVDMTKLKAEYLQHYYDNHHVPIRSWLFANLPVIYQIASINPQLFNFLLKTKLSKFILKLIKIAPQRQLPLLFQFTLKDWAKQYLNKLNPSPENARQKVWLFVDEFTNYIDVIIGIEAIELLTHLNIQVEILPISMSARTYLSKGLVKKAQQIIFRNIENIKKCWNGEYIIGLEPSAILTLRDEYIDLCKNSDLKFMQQVSANCLLFEEFILKILEAYPDIKSNIKTSNETVYIHAHCYQKVLSDTQILKKLYQQIGYTPVFIKSTCCGMAGSFGYEAEHYDLSMKIGELNLFPFIRNLKPIDKIAVSGTSCRQQIQDGTGRITYHPVEVIYSQLVK